MYLARDARLSRDVALKVLPTEVAGDVARLKRFEKEARSASALNHPNIVTIYDIGSEETTSWIAMELVDGKPLREILGSGALPSRRLLAIAAQIAEGLARAHQAGIVHRDLKPENVMVTRDGLVKILDFGLAKQTSTAAEGGDGSHLPTETGTSPGTVLGTAGYMSPEQAAGQPLDFRSDQFSLGSILYEMATGRRAFPGKTGVDTMAAILNAEPAPVAGSNPEIPAPLRWVIERCHAKEPSDRYGTTRDLARELATLRDRLPELSGSGGAPAAGPRIRARSWIPGVVAALALGAAAWLAWRVGGRASATAPPNVRQVTLVKETILHARLTPDGQTAVYSARVNDEPLELFSAPIGSGGPRRLGLSSMTILSISAQGEMAVLQEPLDPGTLAQVPITGGTPRVLLPNVRDASWSPDGKSLAVLHVVDGKNRLEMPIGKVLYETAAGLGAIRFSRDGREIAVRGGGKLKIVDLSGRIRDLGQGVGGFEWSPDGREIWYAESRDGATTIRATTPDGLRRRALISVPGNLELQDVSASGRILLELGAQPWRVYGWTAGDPRVRDLSYRDATVPGDLSPDGRVLLFSEKQEAGAGAAGAAVFLDRGDGSPPRRLGEGWGLSLSPDGKWALSVPYASADRFVLLPTEEGGASREIPLRDLRSGLANWANFLPDGQGIVFSALAPNRPRRIYVVPIDGGEPRPISPEGVYLEVFRSAVSPDGRRVLAGQQGLQVLCPIDGGELRVVPGLEGGDSVVRFADDRTLYVLRLEGDLAKVELLDIETAKRRPWKEFRLPASYPGDLSHALLTPDGKTLVMAYSKWLSNLWVVEGAR